MEVEEWFILSLFSTYYMSFYHSWISHTELSLALTCVGGGERGKEYVENQSQGWRGQESGRGKKWRLPHRTVSQCKRLTRERGSQVVVWVTLERALTARTRTLHEFWSLWRSLTEFIITLICPPLVFLAPFHAHLHSQAHTHWNGELAADYKASPTPRPLCLHLLSIP